MGQTLHEAPEILSSSGKEHHSSVPQFPLCKIKIMATLSKVIIQAP